MPLAGLGFTGLQAWRTYKASDEERIRQAVKKMLKPYPVPRDVMQTIKGIITAWSRQTKRTTIVTGRYQAGKTVAVNEALRGVRGVLQVSVRDASWEEKMYKELGSATPSPRRCRPALRVSWNDHKPSHDVPCQVKA